MNNAFTGISFPFRIGVKGGVVMSSADDKKADHITESLTQLLGTAPKERTMEYSVYCDIPSHLFSLNDIALEKFLESRVREAVNRCESRVDITSLIVTRKNNTVYVNLKYVFIPYNQEYTALLKVGES